MSDLIDDEIGACDDRDAEDQLREAMTKKEKTQWPPRAYAYKFRGEKFDWRAGTISFIPPMKTPQIEKAWEFKEYLSLAESEARERAAEERGRAEAEALLREFIAANSAVRRECPACAGGEPFDCCTCEADAARYKAALDAAFKFLHRNEPQIIHVAKQSPSAQAEGDV